MKLSDLPTGTIIDSTTAVRLYRVGAISEEGVSWARVPATADVGAFSCDWDKSTFKVKLISRHSLNDRQELQ